MKIRAHIFVMGKVQGVFFRSGTRDKALELGIAGWVRNLDDGQVEAVFEGEKENVEKIVEWCRRGPQYAQVEKVEVVPEDYKAEFKGFTVRYS
ncbi:MAG: acylphosphatase [Candidatus Methanoperedens sp.]|nr:acylphosphatase [Candidatus Methanoperedens sp.]